MLKNLHKGFEMADTKAKQQMVGVIFPENLFLKITHFEPKRSTGY